jgi:diguanylate cyclase (GGDEF)-like protein
MRWLVATGLTLLFVGLLVFQGLSIAESEGRRVGVSIDQAERSILLTEVDRGSAAAGAGLRAGDRVIRLDGMRLVKVGDWDLAAADFSPDRAVEVVVLRDGEELTFTLTPGAPYPWLRVAVNALAVFGYLGLVLLVLLQERRDLRTRLLLLFALAVALELVLPIGAIGNYRLLMFAYTGYILLTGFEIGVELHLAALIPERPGWLRRRRWVVPCFYAFGLGLGGTTAATYLAEDIGGLDPFPWTSGQIEDVLMRLGLPLWALGVATLLAVSAFSHRQPHRRQQAGLVLAGVMPWLVVILITSFLDTAVLAGFAWMQTVESLALLCYPVAVFVAIFRYHLFDIELTLRRSILYGLLTGALVLAFYALLGAGGAVVSQFAEEDATAWAIAGATLVLGLLFAPLMRALQRVIDRRLFPERHALRAHLVALASELPSLGKLPLMGDHLVSRIGSIFGSRSATLFLADPTAEVLGLLAARRPPHAETLDSSLLLPLRDPAVVALRRLRRPTSAAGFRESAAVDPESSLLMQRLRLLDAVLLIPLMSQDRLVGLMTLGRRESDERYRNEEIELLDLLSLHVATVFENARLFESATYEGLTGLLRREAILDKLELELQRAQRYGRPLTVGLADLDHFKDVNDRYGHLVGDSMLKRIAGAMQASLRSTDMVGRYGGEEFLLVLPETDLAGAQTVAEKVRRAVQEIRLGLDEGEEASVTVSIGLASLDAVLGEDLRVATPRDLIAAADRALYRAKGAGRNRVHPLLQSAG